MNELLSFDLEAYEDFRKLYDEALDKGEESFLYKGHEILVGYAKYVLEHLRNELNIK